MFIHGESKLTSGEVCMLMIANICKSASGEQDGSGTGFVFKGEFAWRTLFSTHNKIGNRIIPDGSLQIENISLRIISFIFRSFTKVDQFE